jgi:hypothetical protein
LLYTDDRKRLRKRGRGYNRDVLRVAQRKGASDQRDGKRRKE